jgi:dihydroorotase-like cyclic amidohydrolase
MGQNASDLPAESVIAVNADADLVIYDPNTSMTIWHMLFSKAKPATSYRRNDFA